MVEYLENGKFAMFAGRKYTRDDKTGYYLNSTTRTRLHRAVWEHFHGKIPPKMQVHHIDGDKRNNDISNFELLAVVVHQKQHGQELTEAQREARRKNMNFSARPKAIKWHKSKEGRKWHKAHYSNMSKKLHKERKKECVHCGTAFVAKSDHAKYCSNACKSAFRRAQGVDSEVFICEFCGNTHVANKYSKTKYCSLACSNRANPRLPSLRKD